MRILLSNDDGVFAPGLQALVKALLASDVVTSVKVVAPDSEKSGYSAAISMHKKIDITLVDNDIKDDKLIQYAVNGTPADSMLLALHHLYKPQDFDLVITGINSGANLGMDVMLSGTFGAAAIAKTNGVASIATSMVGAKVKGYQNPSAFKEAAKQVVSLIEKEGVLPFLQQQQHQVMNVNIPDVDVIKGIKLTKLSHFPFKQLVYIHEDGETKKQQYQLVLEKNTDHLYSNDKQDSPIDIKVVGDGFVSVSMVALPAIANNNQLLQNLLD